MRKPTISSNEKIDGESKNATADRKDQPTVSPSVSEDSSFSIGRSASLLSMGNMAGRVLGLLREMVITAYFGASGEVSAFRVASQVPTLIYDLLAGGMLSAALVPTLSEYSAPAKREAFVRLAGSLLSLFALLLAIIVLLLEAFAPQVAWLMARGFGLHQPDLIPLTERMLRLILPAVWFISMAGIITGILYAQQRFTAPAMSAAVFNLAIVIVTPILAPNLGSTSLIVGILLGSGAQFSLMAWDLRSFLRQADVRLPLQIMWQHPALRKIVRLYFPIAIITLFSTGQVILDTRLASATGEQSIAWMRNATTLQQLPLGLISVAIALASLPRLSQFFAEGNEQAYRETLGNGLRIVILFIAPAAIGLWLLGEPIIRVLFERGKFLAEDTTQVFFAMRIYVIGMLFAAVDFPLNYAFYARNNTVVPSVAGLASILIYVVAAFSMTDELGYLGLVWSDTLKHGSHVLFMGVAVWLTVGRLQVNTLRFVGKAAVASLGMAIAIWSCQYFLLMNSRAGTSLASDLLSLSIFGGAGLLVYGGILYGLKTKELDSLRSYILSHAGTVRHKALRR